MLQDLGDTLGRYTLLKRLAAGGMGEIYLAARAGPLGFAPPIALKVLRDELASDRNFTEMLVDEAKISMFLNHQNVVSVLDFGEQNGRYYIAMEYVQGVALKELLEMLRARGKRLELATAIYVATELCRALKYAHTRTNHAGEPLNIVHRDVTPGNILLSIQGEVKLTDFGIARAKDRMHQTQAGVLKGKFGYLAPEMLRNEELDSRADLFCAGVILYEMVAGRHPVEGLGVMDAIQRLEEGQISPPSTHNAAIPNALDQICLRALESKPNTRWASAAAFGSALQDFVLADPELRQKIRSGPQQVASLIRSYFPEAFDNPVPPDLAERLLADARDREQKTKAALDGTRDEPMRRPAPSPAPAPASAQPAGPDLRGLSRSEVASLPTHQGLAALRPDDLPETLIPKGRSSNVANVSKGSNVSNGTSPHELLAAAALSLPEATVELATEDPAVLRISSAATNVPGQPTDATVPLSAVTRSQMEAAAREAETMQALDALDEEDQTVATAAVPARRPDEGGGVRLIEPARPSKPMEPARSSRPAPLTPARGSRQPAPIDPPTPVDPPTLPPTGGPSVPDRPALDDTLMELSFDDVDRAKAELAELATQQRLDAQTELAAPNDPDPKPLSGPARNRASLEGTAAPGSDAPRSKTPSDAAPRLKRPPTEAQPIMGNATSRWLKGEVPANDLSWGDDAAGRRAVVTRNAPRVSDRPPPQDPAVITPHPGIVPRMPNVPAPQGQRQAARPPAEKSWLAPVAIALAILAILAVVAVLLLTSAAWPELTFESTPPGATVMIDGDTYQKRTPMKVRVKPNVAHRAELRLSGFPSRRIEPPIEVGFFQSRSYAVTFEDVQRVMHISPVAGRAFVNDQEIGSGRSVQLPQIVDDGPVRLRVEADGYKTWTLQFDTAEQIPASLDVPLQRQ